MSQDGAGWTPHDRDMDDMWEEPVPGCFDLLLALRSILRRDKHSGVYWEPSKVKTIKQNGA